MLPELKTGDVLVTKSGRKVVVLRVNTKARLVVVGHGEKRMHRMSKPRTQRNTGFDEPLYRLVHKLDNGRALNGNAEWTLDELNAVGMKLA